MSYMIFPNITTLHKNIERISVKVMITEKVLLKKKVKYKVNDYVRIFLVSNIFKKVWMDGRDI